MRRSHQLRSGRLNRIELQTLSLGPTKALVDGTSVLSTPALPAVFPAAQQRRDEVERRVELRDGEAPRLSSAIHCTSRFTLGPAPAPPENWKFTKPSLQGQVMCMNAPDPHLAIRALAR
jgi:hypothetical protein